MFEVTQFVTHNPIAVIFIAFVIFCLVKGGSSGKGKGGGSGTGTPSPTQGGQ